jgi:hypothetical protein
MASSKDEYHTFDRLVKKRASWYASDQFKSCRKVIGDFKDSNRSTMDDECPCASSASNLSAAMA